MSTAKSIICFFFEHDQYQSLSQLSFCSSTCWQVYVICLKQANLQDNFVSACINANLSKVKLTAWPHSVKPCISLWLRLLWSLLLFMGSSVSQWCTVWLFCILVNRRRLLRHILQRKHTHSVYPFYSVNSITCKTTLQHSIGDCPSAVLVSFLVSSAGTGIVLDTSRAPATKKRYVYRPHLTCRLERRIRNFDRIYV